MSSAISATLGEIMAGLEPVLWFVNESTYAREGKSAGASDFCFGNPQEMPLAEISQAIAHWAEPQHKDWFAYTFSDSGATATVAQSLRRRLGIEFEPANIAMTNGAFGAIASALRAVVDAGDEVLYLSPPWFFYVPMITSLGAKAVRVDLSPPDFALPLERIAAAITSRTRAIIVNSPHNPSGRILLKAELAGLAEVLERATRRNGRAVYLLSDEAYSRIIFDGEQFHTPLHYYSRSLLLYTYGKTLLTPSQRMGYIAMPPGMPDSEDLRKAINVAQLVMGYAFPNAVMQYAVGDLEKLSIDVHALERRRDRIVHALREMGYEALTPSATFYVLVRSPLEDDVAFTERLAKESVFVLPGRVFECRAGSASRSRRTTRWSNDPCPDSSGRLNPRRQLLVSPLTYRSLPGNKRRSHRRRGRSLKYPGTRPWAGPGANYLGGEMQAHGNTRGRSGEHARRDTRPVRLQA